MLQQGMVVADVAYFIGDMRLPAEERIVKPYHNTWSLNAPLQEAGLLGPVNIIAKK